MFESQKKNIQLPLFEFENLEVVKGRPNYTAPVRMRNQYVLSALEAESMYGGAEKTRRNGPETRGFQKTITN